MEDLMDAEMEGTIVILWLAGVVCGTAFFAGIAGLLYFLWKKYYTRLASPLIAIAIGIMGMSFSLFTILRFVRSWVAG